MSDRRRTLLNGLVAVGVVVAVAVLVAWLRATAPTVDDERLRIDVEEVTADQLLTCEQLADEAAGAVPERGRATSGQVLECPAAFDGRTVSYVGEVVGDVLQRDGGSWLLVNDDDYALRTGPLGASGVPSGTNSGLSVWLPDPLDERVDTPGRAGVRGDVVLVTGEVLRADPADGGGLTLRAEDVEVVAEEVVLDVPVHWRQVGAAAVLAVVAVALTLRDRRERRR